MSDPFIGQITLFPYNFAPEGWADCAGQLLPIQQYAALFSLLGTAYGGNGSTNFALPNLSGRVAVGQGQPAGGSNYGIGAAGGSETVALAQAALPAHSHALNATTGPATTTAPSGALSHGQAAAQVGQREGRRSIAAEIRANEGEQRLILVNWQQLSVALRPTVRGIAESKKLDLTEIRFHDPILRDVRRPKRGLAGSAWCRFGRYGRAG